MSIVSIKKKLIRLYINRQGWKTNRKIVVVESDDWGSIRMPSKEVYKKLLQKGFPVDKYSYLKFDSLESNNDLEGLFEVLTSFRDFKDNHPVITANTVMTNPDFEKIRSSNYTHYAYELFVDTLKKYPNHSRVLGLYKTGIEKKIFFPQYHGREHLNIDRWMASLKDDSSNARKAFEHELFDLSTTYQEISDDRFVDALNAQSTTELTVQKERLLDGLNIFNQVFGFSSLSFIAPCYIWHPVVENTLKPAGVEFFQGNAIQRIPRLDGKNNQFAKKLHYTGEISRSGVVYVVRNAYFEPSIYNNSNKAVDVCLKRIEEAFANKTPAIICTHRLNFIGNINKNNQAKNLLSFQNLLAGVLKKWPDVEFMTSPDLGLEIKNK